MNTQTWQAAVQLQRRGRGEYRGRLRKVRLCCLAQRNEQSLARNYRRNASGCSRISGFLATKTSSISIWGIFPRGSRCCRCGRISCSLRTMSWPYQDVGEVIGNIMVEIVIEAKAGAKGKAQGSAKRTGQGSRTQFEQVEVRKSPDPCTSCTERVGGW